MDKDYLILKRALAGRSSGEWGDDDYVVHKLPPKRPVEPDSPSPQPYSFSANS